MMKEVRHYMEHDGLIDKPVVEKPPDPDDQDQQEVKKDFSFIQISRNISSVNLCILTLGSYFY